MGVHSHSRTRVETAACSQRTNPTGRVVANAAACDPLQRRTRIGTGRARASTVTRLSDVQYRLRILLNRDSAGGDRPPGQLG
jgi:hypothetical protein